MELSKENLKKIKGLILFTALIVVCLWKYDMVFQLLGFVFHVIFPFVLGGSIAFVLNVPMSFIEKHLFPEKKREKHRFLQKMARPMSLVIILLCVAGVLSLILFVLIPQLGSTFSNLGERIQAFIPSVQRWTQEIFNGNTEIWRWAGNLEFDWNQVMQIGMRFFRSGAENMFDSTIVVLRNIISGIAAFFIAFVFSCYILLQKERLSRQVKKVLFAFVPRGKAEAALEVCSLIYYTFSGFLTGQCVEAIILGSMFVAALLLLRLPYALLIGIIIAFTALIPVFGSFIGCVLGTFLIFMVNPVQALLFLVVFLALQQIEGNLIYPHVVGNSVGLPSIWVLAAVSVGGSLMGIVGMLIFIPLVSVLYALFRVVIELKLRKRNINPDEIE